MINDTVHVFVNFVDTRTEQLYKSLFAAAMPEANLVYWDKEEQFINGLSEAEYMLAINPPRGHWSKATNLKLLQNFGAGIDDFLPADDLPNSVTVTNAQGVTAEPMSDYGLALVLMLSKGIHRAITTQRQQQWKRYMPGDVANQTLGIMGLGAIGTPLARKAKLLGYRVLGLNHRKKPNEFADETYGLSEIDDFLGACDIVVLLLPITDETRGLMNRERLDKMKKGAFMVNLARGGIVDEQAIIEKLHDRSLGGAAFDVFEQEPLPSDSPLWNTPNLVVTPHNAGLFPTYTDAIFELFAKNIACIKADEPVLTPVDLNKGY